MGEIILVRHGQANSSARDEEGYDRLSDLGHQQAAWLGDYMRDREGVFYKVISGSLRRHRVFRAPKWAFSVRLRIPASTLMKC